MQPKLDKQLCRAFPDIFRDRQADIRNSCMPWGFECGDGWYKLISELCTDLTLIKKLTGVGIKATQVKEKYAGLRFYYSGQAKSGLKRKLSNDSAAVWRIIDSLISNAEHKSEYICDICGEYGATVVHHGWLYALCTKHHTQLLMTGMVSRLAPKTNLTEKNTKATIRRLGLRFPKRFSDVVMWLGRLAYSSKEADRIFAMLGTALMSIPVASRTIEDWTRITAALAITELGLTADVLKVLGTPGSVLDAVYWLGVKPKDRQPRNGDSAHLLASLAAAESQQLRILADKLSEASKCIPKTS